MVARGGVCCLTASANATPLLIEFFILTLSRQQGKNVQAAGQGQHDKQDYGTNALRNTSGPKSRQQ